MNKMNHWIAGIFFVITTGSAFSAPAVFLDCQSQRKIKGWVDGKTTNDYLKLSAEMGRNAKLLDAEFSGAYRTEALDLRAIKSSGPRTPSIFNHYMPHEDGQHQFTLSLPSRMVQMNANYGATLKIERAGSSVKFVTLTCQLTRESQ